MKKQPPDLSNYCFVAFVARVIPMFSLKADFFYQINDLMKRIYDATGIVYLVRATT